MRGLLGLLLLLAGCHWVLPFGGGASDGARRDVAGDSVRADVARSDVAHADARTEARPDASSSDDDDYPTGNVRSIGAAVFNTSGTATCSGNDEVTFSTKLPDPVGPGDRVVIGSAGASETFYVRGRLTGSRVRLQSACGAGHIGDSFRIERAYSTLQDWEDDRGGKPLAAREVGVAYPDGPFTAGVKIDGATTDGARYMVLSVAKRFRHGGRFGVGPQIALQSPADAVVVKDDYTIVEWLEIRGFGTTSGGSMAPYSGVLVEGAGQCRVRHNLIHDNAYYGASNGIKVLSASGTNLIYGNLIARGWQERAIAVGLSAHWSNAFPPRFYNNTVFGTMYGVVASATENVQAVNNLVVAVPSAGQGGTAFLLGDAPASWSSSSGHNASSDATAPGNGSVVNTTPLVFSKTDNSSPEGIDLHLSADPNQAVDAGQDLSDPAEPMLQMDIDGQVRPKSAWDIGADERVP